MRGAFAELLAKDSNSMELDVELTALTMAYNEAQGARARCVRACVGAGGCTAGCVSRPAVCLLGVRTTLTC
jgi:hypothetical protein